MMVEPTCSKRKCKHFQGVSSTNGTEETEVVICAAFPTGIPFEIAYGKDRHAEIHLKQSNDIVFEKA